MKVGSTQILDGVMFTAMLRSSAENLRKHVQSINNLNVFPIPDGDTGDNMLLTIIGGADSLNENISDLSIASRKAADGMLLSARGNSGVILSQLFDGIAEGFSNMSAAEPAEIGKALCCGVQHAYNAVMEPTEGTILTVAKSAAEYVCNCTPNSLEDLAESYLDEARRTLNHTPEMLPVLKKAGVVDSGGAGLVYIAEGAKKALNGDNERISVQNFSPQPQELNLDLFTEDSVLEYGYCTECLLRLQNSKTDPESFDVETITDYLKSVGDSVVAFKTGSVVKIHVHTMTPGAVLDYCQNYGEFLKIKIESMSLQHNNSSFENVAAAPQSAEQTERKAYGVVAVASGSGIKQTFLEHGADVIVDGGQSSNPSAEEFLAAFDKVNAKTIIVLPNNPNIYLTAKQAADMYKNSDVRVVESKSIGDGYAALTMLDTTSKDTESILADLNCAMKNVVTLKISQSVKDCDVQAVPVAKGDYIGFIGSNILAADKNRLQAMCSAVDKSDVDGYDICIIFCGCDSDNDDTEAFKKYMSSRYPGKEIYVVDGMQEVYDYIMVLE